MEPAKTMDSIGYREACATLKISVYASADVLGISLRQAQRYASGESPVPDTVAKLLRALIALGRLEV